MAPKQAVGTVGAHACLFTALPAPRHCMLSVAGGAAQVRVHTREGTLKPVTDVTLEREAAQWPPKLTSAERADIMRPEALRSDQQLLSGEAPGARRRHLLVSPCCGPGVEAEAWRMRNCRVMLCNCQHLHANDTRLP